MNTTFVETHFVSTHVLEENVLALVLYEIIYFTSISHKLEMKLNETIGTVGNNFQMNFKMCVTFCFLF